MGYLHNALQKVGLAQPGPKITQQDRAILDLKLQRDKLKQYQKRLQAVLDKEQEIAKRALKEGNKKRALTALRQRKYQEQLLSKTDGQLQTLQELVSTIEFSQIQAAVLHGISVGNEVLKQLQSEMSLEKVDKLMEETREGIEYQREIDEALMSRMSPEEEEAVQEELAQLEREAFVRPCAEWGWFPKARLPQPAIPSVPEQQPVTLPEAPQTEPMEPVKVQQPGERSERASALIFGFH
ncbi:Snf7-domain-containing protein [Kockovaella imperatae]|uniref:Snf7-domain-containing protein n=1 Tax=Kockovaella imperatae TaxID=4999 RepID=A0A1Y1UGZ2_9TREE|nr:Snf7-domain-containing protein [Kockovaella imperatae]ORX37323.1 Snf7-domain-containing protein [Kockovaella imperatae]